MYEVNSGEIVDPLVRRHGTELQEVPINTFDVDGATGVRTIRKWNRDDIFLGSGVRFAV